MVIYDRLRRLLGGPKTDELDQLAIAWGIDTGADADAASPKNDSTFHGTTFDRTQWRKKVATILDDLPARENDWGPLVAEGLALGFDPEWMDAVTREEFTLLIRRTVADCVFNEFEHKKLDLARTLIGMNEDEAERAVHAVVVEVEAFFGRRVEGA